MFYLVWWACQRNKYGFWFGRNEIMNDDTEFAPFACHSDFHISKWILHDSLEHCKSTTYRNIGNESDSAWRWGQLGFILSCSQSKSWVMMSHDLTQLQISLLKFTLGWLCQSINVGRKSWFNVRLTWDDISWIRQTKKGVGVHNPPRRISPRLLRHLLKLGLDWGHP